MGIEWREQFSLIHGGQRAPGPDGMKARQVGLCSTFHTQHMK